MNTVIELLTCIGVLLAGLVPLYYLVVDDTPRKRAKVYVAQQYKEAFARSLRDAEKSETTYHLSMAEGVERSIHVSLMEKKGFQVRISSPDRVEFCTTSKLQRTLYAQKLASFDKKSE